MSLGYWLGLATLPALAGFAYVAAWVGFRVAHWFDDRGWSMDLRLKRDIDGVSDYTLRHDIWWERAFGPVFIGGWYREQPTYDKPDQIMATRWVGIGRTNGPCVCLYRFRHLGEGP